MCGPKISMSNKRRTAFAASVGPHTSFLISLSKEEHHAVLDKGNGN